MLANEPKSAIQTVSIVDLEEQRPYKSTTGYWMETEDRPRYDKMALIFVLQ